MSKKSSGSTKSPKDALPGLLLDENVGSRLITRVLREFDKEWAIKRHGDYFKRAKTPDPEVIARCGKEGWGIISADDSMWFMHQQALQDHKIRLFTFTSGNLRRAEYLAALVFGRRKIIDFMKTAGPFCGRIQKNGHVAITRGLGALSQSEISRLANEYEQTLRVGQS